MSFDEGKWYKLSEVTNIVGGGTPKTSNEEYWNGDIPWLSVVDFGGENKKVYTTEKQITEKGLKESSTKILKKGQLIISARGTVGEIAMLGKDMAFNQSCYGLDAKECTSNDYLYYLVKQNIIEIKTKTHGAVFDTITKETFNHINVFLPSLATQQHIAAILSSLDDKIELNRLTNQTLEAIAQALFKEWFVDFNFPGATGEMVESKLGEIPKGWKVYNVSELVDTVSITHKFPKGKAIFLNTSDIQEGKILHRNYSDKEGLPGQAKKSIKELDILFTEIRPGNKRYALIDFDAQDFVVSTKLMVLRSLSNVHPIVVYNFLTSYETLKQLQHLAESRSGTFPQITFDQVKDMKVVFPEGGILNKYETLAWSFFKQVKNNEEQIKTLVELRDTLLPKLMKGELSI